MENEFKGEHEMAKVILLAHTPNPEQTVAAAAKLCYSSSDITGLTDSLTDEKAAAFVEMLSEIGHESPIEHASFTFGIEGDSRSLLAQITRHRILLGKKSALCARGQLRLCYPARNCGRSRG